ncbi:5-formyltetrahydrofolate cyclo-ligase [Cecembia lonarensis]|uniref:5-formyltetrahydrofolate cyclo-ligase n=1 Tax=Cecembia lonarensis (strain CCUG 58316 / KCTC 22772 / LW9) TaxID=1225176 RepID=K1KYF4_CECL9|nr:5-formyltetrahydrofolate cyclo-ligase [Cecembia lonarensis]EKB47541.1 putative 5-formyltetrahydrofolate cyclo-ligase [Cecembia lonarensis LW9]
MDKEALRLAYRKRRRELSREQIRDFSAEMTAQFLEYLKSHQEIRHIHLFLPIDRFHEVDTFPLFYTLQEKGYFLYTSQVNKTADQLETLDISGIRGFESGDWGIPVPIDAKKCAPDSIQMVLIPLLAFDVKGFRIGYGKGYYDKFLAGLDQCTMKVGLSFFLPERTIPTEPHDIPLDLCIVPGQIFHFNT